MPIISVIMPVYNTKEQYLREAIESVLSQTFSDFEFFIINDGSTNNAEAVIKSYNDERIKYIYQNHAGIVEALNNGLKQAKGKYIARMDSDDICVSSRFEKQVRYMEKNKKVGLCGTCVEEFDETGIIPGVFAPFKKHPKMIDILFMTIICHPTAMFRTSVLKNNNILYSFDYPFAEDHDMWHQMLKVSRVYVLQKKLLRYRRHCQSSSSVNAEFGANSHKKVKAEIIKELYPNIDLNINNFDYIMSEIWKKYHCVKNKNRMSFAQTIFSVKNQNIHKVITLFGIKFKFKSKKLIKKLELKHNHAN